MFPKNPLLQKCFRYLESLLNLSVSIQDEPYSTDKVLADGMLEISKDEAKVTYICEIKTGLINESLPQIKAYFDNFSQRLQKDQRALLITQGLSNSLINSLQESNIEFIDIDGSLYLNNPCIYMLVNNYNKKIKDRKSSEITAANLQVMYAIMRYKKPLFDITKHIFNQALHKNYYEKIAYTSGVSLSTVRNTIEKLKKLKYIKKRFDEYEITNDIEFLERWELGYTERLRDKLFIGTFIPAMNRFFSEVTPDIEEYASPDTYLIGGELGAALLTNYIRPIGATLHLHPSMRESEVAVKLKLKPDPQGKVIMLKSFGEDQEYKQKLIHPLLIHAELMYSEDSRLEETANKIYDKYIEEIISQNA
jgi:hypothetical protein